MKTTQIMLWGYCLLGTILVLEAVTGTWEEHSGKYLSGYSGGDHKYSKLEQAQSECLKRADCGGITYEPYSKMYTLRKGSDLEKSPSNEVSWLFAFCKWEEHSGKYLSGYSGGVNKYSKLEQAQSECLKRTDCGGITYEPYSSTWTLRKGGELHDSPSKEISWIHSCCDVHKGMWEKHDWKYLSGYSGGVHKYSKLEEAQSQCLKRTDCGGITYEPYSNMYTLRRGGELQASPRNEISWLHASCDSGPPPLPIPGPPPKPVNGKFGKWSKWSPCTKKCGGGERTRTRSCDKPNPECTGKTEQTKKCNVRECKEKCLRCDSSADSDCIPKAKICDGKNDCPSPNAGADEAPEMCRDFTCPSKKTKCKDGLQCVWKKTLCNGREDCKDGSDENSWSSCSSRSGGKE